MTVLWVLLGIVAVFWLLGRIRLGGFVQYDEDGVLVRVIAGPVRLTVFPRQEKKLTEEEKEKQRRKKEKDRLKKEKQKARQEAKKAKQEAEKARKEAEWREKHPGEEPPKPKKGGALPPFTELLPLVADAAGGFKNRLRIDTLTLHLTWAAGDPMETALGYGRANAAMGMIWPLIDHNFNVKEHDLQVGVDFTAESPTILCRAALTIRLGQIVSLGLKLGIKFLIIWSRHRVRSGKKQEA